MAEDDLINEMLADNVNGPFTLPWVSLVRLAKMPDGSYRFCVDHRRVNAVSRKDAYPIPDTQDAFDSLQPLSYSLSTGRLVGRPGPEKDQLFAPVGASTIVSVCHSGCLMRLPHIIDSCTGCFAITYGVFAFVI